MELLGKSDITISGQHARIIRDMTDGDKGPLYSEQPIELMYLAVFIGALFDKKGVQDNRDTENRITLSRVQFEKVDPKLIAQYRLILLNREGNRNRETANRVFRMPTDEAERSTAFEEWLSYALGGLEIISERVLQKHNEDQYEDLNNWQSLFIELESKINDNLFNEIGQILKG